MDLIQHLLVVDPMSRYTATKALQTDWLKIEDDVLAHTDLEQKRSSMRLSLNSVVRLKSWRNNSIMSDITMDDGRRTSFTP